MYARTAGVTNAETYHLAKERVILTWALLAAAGRRLLPYRDESISHSIWFRRPSPPRHYGHCVASGRRVQMNAFIIFITIPHRLSLCN